ncbi:Hpt domain-containing protein, partial [Oleiphilus sp. HI0079]
MATLAWAVESRLNSRVDQSLSISLEELNAVDSVREHLSGLLADFSKGAESELARQLENSIARVFDNSSASPGIDPESPDERSMHQEPAIEEQPAVEPTDQLPEMEQSIVEDVPEDVEQPPVMEVAESVEDDDDLIDEEILEIFIEESEEVNETIQAYLPRLVENYDDKEALTELRRAFHTLKG